ncbi:MAG: aminoacyl-tRNA hydrolase [Bdellovibrionales bacterium]|nr:aminoacyl-tRNA hydrolase [Bdellovibrionales bacterium]
MYLIVGLGNPGIKYKLTRHNIGFLVIDALADHFNVRVDTEDFNSVYAKFKIGNEEVLLVKPLTFMNLSGEAVQPIMAYYKIPVENVLVIHDEVDLPFKTIKFQKSRGHGGHNGIRNIHEKIGQDYARLRLGVGRPTIPQMSVADFVLQNFGKEQEAELADFIGQACDATLDFIEEGFIKAQGRYN